MEDETTQPTKPLRTKVKIMSTSVFGQTENMTMAYEPTWDSTGLLEMDSNGVAIHLKKLGGVKVGAIGEICGPTVRALRSALHNYEKQTSLGADTVEIIPVELTEYKRVAWFPSHWVVVVAE